jgi:ribose transport system substrate-binding protein
MKRIIFLSTVILATLFVAGLLFGCGPAAETPTEGPEESPEDEVATDLKFAWSPATLDNPYFITVTDGFRERCEELGIEPLFADPAYDATQQYNQFENWIAMGVDAISACPVDTRSLEDATAAAQNAGIVVVGEAQGIENANANVIVDDYGYGVINGEAAARWINEKLGGEAKVLVITLDHVEAVILRADGTIDKITELTNAEIVARQAARTIEEAMNIAETVLQANPDVNVIACINDQLALGAWQAVQNLGIVNENFYIGGADYTDEAIAAMNEPGSYFRMSTDILPYQTGRDLVDVMYRHVTDPSAPMGEVIYIPMEAKWQDGLGW